MEIVSKYLPIESFISKKKKQELYELRVHSKKMYENLLNLCHL